jgi:hypothetical protein
MLGLLLIYFIGKYYYELAQQHDKRKWAFAILGVVAYYAGAFVMGIILGIIFPDAVDTMNNLILSLLALPMGLLFTWGLYKILENRWSNPVHDDFDDSDILDRNLNNPPTN